MSSLATRRHLFELVQGFQSYWNSDQNLFSEDTEHASFASLSHYFREQSSNIKEPDLSNLAQFIEECLNSSDSNLSEAVATCFLENIICDKEQFILYPYLGDAAKSFIAKIQA